VLLINFVVMHCTVWTIAYSQDEVLCLERVFELCRSDLKCDLLHFIVPNIYNCEKKIGTLKK
jgi:hypothetical protein